MCVINTAFLGLTRAFSGSTACSSQPLQNIKSFTLFDLPDSGKCRPLLTNTRHFLNSPYQMVEKGQNVLLWNVPFKFHWVPTFWLHTLLGIPKWCFLKLSQPYGKQKRSGLNRQNIFEHWRCSRLHFSVCRKHRNAEEKPISCKEIRSKSQRKMHEGFVIKSSATISTIQRRIQSQSRKQLQEQKQNKTRRWSWFLVCPVLPTKPLLCIYPFARRLRSWLLALYFYEYDSSAFTSTMPDPLLADVEKM